ncbi:MAG: cytoplasmic protein [Devosiaceae bacterium]
MKRETDLELPMIRALTLVLATLVASSALATTALAHDGRGTHEPSGYLDARDLPTCDARGVLGQVSEKEAYRGQAAYQYPVAITGYDHVRQTRHIGSTGPGLRERRWCQARAHLASGHTRTVYYVIEGHASFIGATYGVESCMVGRDLWNVHGGDCSALRIW